MNLFVMTFGAHAIGSGAGAFLPPCATPETPILGTSEPATPSEQATYSVARAKERDSVAATMMAGDPAVGEPLASSVTPTLLGATKAAPMGKAAEGIRTVVFAAHASSRSARLNLAQQAGGLTITVPHGALALGGRAGTEPPGAGQASLQATDGDEDGCAYHRSALTATSAHRFTFRASGSERLVLGVTGARYAAVTLGAPRAEVL